MSGQILVIAERRGNALTAGSRDAISFGQRLADQLSQPFGVLLIGNEIGPLAEQMSQTLGIEILCLSDERLAEYAPETYCDVISQAIHRSSPEFVILAHSYQAADFVPRLATKLNRSFIANCTNYRILNGRVAFIKSVCGGKLHQYLAPKGASPYFVSVQQGLTSADIRPGRQDGRIVNMSVATVETPAQRRILEVIQEAQDAADLGRAEIIVAGGRGLGNKENFKLIVELARALGGSVGATRPVVDGGWIPKAHQVGISGQSVAPRLYIACAISGAHHHLVGMMRARCVVAINKDPDAPIFEVADYGIVGDVLRVVPFLIEAARGSSFRVS